MRVKTNGPARDGCAANRDAATATSTRRQWRMATPSRGRNGATQNSPGRQRCHYEQYGAVRQLRGAMRLRMRGAMREWRARLLPQPKLCDMTYSALVARACSWIHPRVIQCKRPAAE